MPVEFIFIGATLPHPAGLFMHHLFKIPFALSPRSAFRFLPSTFYSTPIRWNFLVSPPAGSTHVFVPGVAAIPLLTTIGKPCNRFVLASIRQIFSARSGSPVRCQTYV